MNSLSLQHIPHKSMSYKWHVNTIVICCNQVFQIDCWRRFFLYYYAHTIYTLHMRFYITKMTFVVRDGLTTNYLQPAAISGGSSRPTLTQHESRRACCKPILG
jgi:hypothetical protein